MDEMVNFALNIIKTKTKQKFACVYIKIYKTRSTHFIYFNIAMIIFGCNEKLI